MTVKCEACGDKLLKCDKCEVRLSRKDPQLLLCMHETPFVSFQWFKFLMHNKPDFYTYEPIYAKIIKIWLMYPTIQPLLESSFHGPSPNNSKNRGPVSDPFIEETAKFWAMSWIKFHPRDGWWNLKNKGTFRKTLLDWYVHITQRPVILFVKSGYKATSIHKDFTS